MAFVKILTEDEVRDGYTDGTGFHKGAKQILEFDKAEKNVQQGTGQLKTYKQLGFSGNETKDVLEANTVTKLDIA